MSDDRALPGRPRPAISIIALVVIKTALDIAAHKREREKLAVPAESVNL